MNGGFSLGVDWQDYTKFDGELVDWYVTENMYELPVYVWVDPTEEISRRRDSLNKPGIHKMSSTSARQAIEANDPLPQHSQRSARLAINRILPIIHDSDQLP